MQQKQHCPQDCKYWDWCLFGTCSVCDYSLEDCCTLNLTSFLTFYWDWYMYCNMICVWNFPCIYIQFVVSIKLIIISLCACFIYKIPYSIYTKFMHSKLNSFIHSGHFYSTPSSPLLLGDAPDYSTDTVSEFHTEVHRQLQVKDLPKVPTWRLERESNPRPSGWESSSQPRHHHVRTQLIYFI